MFSALTSKFSNSEVVASRKISSVENPITVEIKYTTDNTVIACHGYCMPCLYIELVFSIAVALALTKHCFLLHFMYFNTFCFILVLFDAKRTP